MADMESATRVPGRGMNTSAMVPLASVLLVM